MDVVWSSSAACRSALRSLRPRFGSGWPWLRTAASSGAHGNEVDTSRLITDATAWAV